jgi:hypothetical protein
MILRDDSIEEISFNVLIGKINHDNINAVLQHDVSNNLEKLLQNSRKRN